MDSPPADLVPEMAYRCHWCGKWTDTDRCQHCDRLRDGVGFTYVVYGGGIARDTGSRATAEQLLDRVHLTNPTARLYVAFNVVGYSLEQRARLVLRDREFATFVRLLRQVMEPTGPPVDPPAEPPAADPGT
jgi:hypothetical protein